MHFSCMSTAFDSSNSLNLRMLSRLHQYEDQMKNMQNLNFPASIFWQVNVDWQTQYNQSYHTANICNHFGITKIGGVTNELLLPSPGIYGITMRYAQLCTKHIGNGCQYAKNTDMHTVTVKDTRTFANTN